VLSESAERLGKGAGSGFQLLRSPPNEPRSSRGLRAAERPFRSAPGMRIGEGVRWEARSGSRAAVYNGAAPAQGRGER